MPKHDSLGYYAVLDVNFDDDISVIKKQYYQKAKYWHPDHNTAPQAQDMFQTTSVAYDTLQNPQSRLVYDLLSCVYDTKDFPPIGSLKIYKNQSNKDDKALRVLKQRVCTDKGLQERKDICNIREAGNMVLATAKTNWTKGWWQKNGIKRTLAAIKYNMQSVDADDADNLKLLVHNAVAYAQENDAQMAWIYAKQALLNKSTDSLTEQYLTRFIESLDYHPDKKVVLPYWNAAELKRRQFVFPTILLLCVVLLILYLLARNGIFITNTAEDNRYYEVRRFGDVLVPSDMVESRIIKTDSSPYDKEYIMHLSDKCKIYYGPDSRYTFLRFGESEQTVRITGYTIDKKWYQIIMDDGAVGYLRGTCLKKGFGAPVPHGSQVYKE